MISARKLKILAIFFSILPLVKVIQYLDAKHHILGKTSFFRNAKQTVQPSQGNNQLVEAADFDTVQESKDEYIYDPSITEDEVANFISKLQTVVAAGDVASLAGMLSSKGCTLNAGPFKPPVSINSEEDLRVVYDTIMTEEMKNIILEANSENIFNNYQGFMIGDGELWFDPRDGILVFNLP